MVEMFPRFDQVRLQLGDVTNLVAVRALLHSLQLPQDLVVYWVEVRTVSWPDSWVNNCIVSRGLWAGALFRKQMSLVESGSVTALINVTKSGIFCC